MEHDTESISRSFTILSPDETVSVICPTVLVRDQWFKGLDFLRRRLHRSYSVTASSMVDLTKVLNNPSPSPTHNQGLSSGTIDGKDSNPLSVGTRSVENQVITELSSKLGPYELAQLSEKTQAWQDISR